MWLAVLGVGARPDGGEEREQLAQPLPDRYRTARRRQSERDAEPGDEGQPLARAWPERDPFGLGELAHAAMTGRAEAGDVEPFAEVMAEQRIVSLAGMPDERREALVGQI